MKIILLENTPILEQLRLEEALLRADDKNWCLINTNSPPAIVMGISGKPKTLLDYDKIGRDQVPVIRRFSGGGTVYIDFRTVFVTFICNAQDFGVTPQPRPILEWSEHVYKPLFPGFLARENDYVFGEKKFGGNAQYIQKGRWLHHTSFLWDFDPTKMEYLLLPERRPKYRESRSHTDFLCTLRPLFHEKEGLIAALRTHFLSQFHAQIASKEDYQEILQRPHRQATQLINIDQDPEELNLDTPHT